MQSKMFLIYLNRNYYVLKAIAKGANKAIHACSSLKGCSFADMEQIILKAKRKAIIESSMLTSKHIRYSIEEYKPHLNMEAIS